MEYGLIGEKLAHSLSVVIHSEILGYNYIKKEIIESELESFIKQKSFKGLNVTIPFKERVIPFLDVISENAKRIGAVNTVVNKNGILYGYNTDYWGLLSLLKKANINLKNKNILILGTGGTAKTAYCVCKDLKASYVAFLSRNKTSENIFSYSDISKIKDKFEVIINTTPSGMYPNVESILIDDDFKNLKAVVDVVYNPLRSALIQKFEKKCLTVSGLYMLSFQAVKSAELFDKVNYSEDLEQLCYKKLLNRYQNIVLIGPPYSGKTTIGKKLSKTLNMNFVDTDEEIEKQTSLKVKDIILNKGIECFRDIEKQVIKKVSLLNNTVISTGGGAVLDKENIFYLKLYGKMVFVYRDVKDIIIDNSRPLTNTTEKLNLIFNERFSTYNENSDYIIYNKEIDYAVGRIVEYYENLCN